jgi:hypothetical protein
VRGRCAFAKCADPACSTQRLPGGQRHPRGILAAVPMPSDIGIIDLMMALPITDPERTYA